MFWLTPKLYMGLFWVSVRCPSAKECGASLKTTVQDIGLCTWIKEKLILRQSLN